MHYSNVQSASEKLGILNIFKKEDKITVILSKSRYGANREGGFPALEVVTGQDISGSFVKSFVKYRGGEANTHLGFKISFCDLPEDLKGLLGAGLSGIEQRENSLDTVKTREEIATI